MKVVYFPKQLSKEKTTLILGGFESFHNGHMQLLEKARELKKPIAIMVLTNLEKLPNHDKQIYQELEIRLQQFANLNIKYASVVKFNQELMSLEGNVFLDQLIKSVNAYNLIFGKDFKVGKNRGYDSKRILNEYKNAFVVEKFKIKDKKISTTLLKELIFVGDVDLIRQICPFPYTIKVKVNANNTVDYKNNILPHAGIYSIFVVQNEIRYYGILHISIAKKVFIKVPDLQIRNNSYEPTIIFIKQVRTIIKSNEDKIFSNNDEHLVLKSLNNI